jgi:hypothetical protein
MANYPIRYRCPTEQETQGDDSRVLQVGIALNGAQANVTMYEDLCGAISYDMP